jgi:hypothetical protein
VPGTIVISNNCAREHHDNNQARNKFVEGKSAGNKHGKEIVRREQVCRGTFVFAILKAESNQRMILIPCHQKLMG